jgi:phthalate 4,5-cis-dihydrodiol dehydrogenase
LSISTATLPASRPDAMTPTAVDPAPIGLGIAGLGMAGAVMVQAAAAHGRYVLRAAADPHPAPRAAFARDFNASVYDDIGALCADPAVEVVYIATPHQFHAPHAILAAEHGKHIILEKPMALTLADCDAIIAAAERAGVYLIVGHTHAFDPAVRIMRDIVVCGALGRLGTIHSFNYTNFLYRPRRPEELDTAQGGGILFNQVPHQIDMVRLLAGGLARSVRAQVTALDPARPTEGSCAALLQFENGAAASLVYSGYDYFDSDEWHFGVGERGALKAIDHGAARRALMKVTDEAGARAETFAYGSSKPDLPPHQPHFGITIVTCEKGELRASADGLIRYDQSGPMKINIDRGIGMPGRREVLDDMSRALRLHMRPTHDGRWGKATLEVALAMLQSAREGREIMLEHQVAVPKKRPAVEEDGNAQWRIEARIADWPARGVYAKD